MFRQRYRCACFSCIHGLQFFFLGFGIHTMGKQKISFPLLLRSSNQCWQIFFLEQELLKLSDGSESFTQSDSLVSDQICWSRWWSGVREIRHKEAEDTCEWWVQIGWAPGAVCTTRKSWETIKLHSLGHWNLKDVLQWVHQTSKWHWKHWLGCCPDTLWLFKMSQALF